MILLLDGMNMIHRSNIKFGKPGEFSYTLVFNFFRSLKALVEKFKPEKVFFCLEGKNNFRYSVLKSYKANRIIKMGSQKEVAVFQDQRDLIIDLLNYLPITKAYSETFEADDVIATLADNLKDEEIIIVSTDEDYWQLLNDKKENIKLFNPKLKTYVEAPDYHYLVWKCLRGDKSDNIPGLVSDERAMDLVKDPQALKDFLASDENKANFNLNKNLIELKIISDSSLDLKEGNLDLNYLKNEFTKMEFKSMIVDKYWGNFSKVFNSLCQ